MRRDLFPAFHHKRLERLRPFAAPALTLLVALIIYRGWLRPGIITAGDWIPTPQASMLDNWPTLPLWGGELGTGGSQGVFGSIIFPQLNLYGLMAHLGIAYSWAQRLIFVFPCIVVACIGGYIFSYSLFRSRVAAAITGLFLVCNSYIVIIDGGGQFLVGVAFAFIPLILWSFRSALHSNQPFRYVLAGLLIALQGTYDLRLTYITILALILYVPFLIADVSDRVGIGRAFLRLVALAFACGCVALPIHAPWLLQALLVRGTGLAAPPKGYTNASQAMGLSFMLMSNAISMMHPFWPLNPLGHIAPLNPLFFLAPLLIFTLLLHSSLSRDVQYLFLLSLLAIFFVKGVQAPASQIYVWIFLHVPGFEYFRDPSKFYQPLMVSMGTLLGLAVVESWSWLRGHLPVLRAPLVMALWVACWLLITIYPALPGIFTSMAGTMTPLQVPQDYAQLNAMIDRQPQYFRTLWFPRSSPFVTYSQRHPLLGTADNIGSSDLSSLQLPNSNLYSWIRLPSAPRVLQTLSVKYVIVPPPTQPGAYGPQNSGMTFQAALAMARHGLRGFRETTIGAIHVFENPHFLPLVYTPSRVHIQDLGPGGPPVPPLPKDVLNPPTVAGPLGVFTANRLSSSGGRTTVYNAQGSLPHIRMSTFTTSRIDVEVRGATQPFMLMFLQSYDPNWRAYIVPAGASPSWLALQHAAPISQDDHMLGEGFANAWWLTARGSYDVILLFWPQEVVTIGGIACWIAILGYSSYVVLAWQRSTRKARNGRKPRRVVSEPDLESTEQADRTESLAGVLNV